MLLRTIVRCPVQFVSICGNLLACGQLFSIRPSMLSFLALLLSKRWRRFHYRFLKFDVICFGRLMKSWGNKYPNQWTPYFLRGAGPMWCRIRTTGELRSWLVGAIYTPASRNGWLFQRVRLFALIVARGTQMRRELQRFQSWCVSYTAN